MAKPKKATGAWKIRSWTPLNVVDLGEKSSCSLLQKSATEFIGFSGCQPARIPPCLSSHRGEHCNYIWRFLKIWGDPQSSSILEDVIFHDINHHFRATPMTSWKPPDPCQERHFFAAYSSGDQVEYFSATQGKWLLGEVQFRWSRPCGPSKKRQLALFS